MNYLEKLLKDINKKKSITYEELNNLLPEDIIIENKIEDIIDFLSDNNITIIENKNNYCKINKDYNNNIIIDNIINTPDKFYFYELSKSNTKSDSQDFLFKAYLEIKNKITSLVIKTDFFQFQIFKDIAKGDPKKKINSILYKESEKNKNKIIKTIKDLYKTYTNNKDITKNKSMLTSFLNELNLKFNYINEKIELLVHIKDELDNFDEKNRNIILKRNKINKNFLQNALPEINLLYKEYKKIKQKLTKTQLPLVISITKHYFNEKYNKNDLIQEGNIALIEALDYYDLKVHNKKFYQFVSSWIRKKVKDFIGRTNSLLKTSNNFKKECKLFIKTFNKLKNNLLRTPAINELKNELKWTDDKIKLITNYIKNEESIEKSNNSMNLNLKNALYNKMQKLPEDIAIENILKEKIEKSLTELSENEGIIIKMRFGFNYETRIYTYTEIAKILHQTENEIKNKEELAIKKLRIIFKSNNMEEFI